MSKPKLATIWLDGCSGCHMSFLDTDERLIEIVEKFDLVYSPLVDAKEFPSDVAVTLVEGAVSTDEDYEKILKLRQRSKIIVAFGDCAITANVPSMRNQFKVREVLEHSYIETASNKSGRIPRQSIPILRDRAIPIHEVVHVDVFLQGCPPSADLIYFTLMELLEGRMPDFSEKARFG